MTRFQATALAALGSAALLLGAFGFQYIGGLAPCHLCLLQRWPHAAAVAIGALALALRNTVMARLLPWAGALAALTTAGLGAYHTGVEKQWWLGPTTCTSGNISKLSAADLLAQIQAAPVVQCDKVAWAMWGVSMASWNMLASLALAGLWVYAAARREITGISSVPVGSGVAFVAGDRDGMKDVTPKDPEPARITRKT